MSNLLRGYASVFNNVDTDGEIVAPGAFKDFIATGQQLPIFFGHKNIKGPWEKPEGITTLLKEDDYGLYFEGVFADTREAKDTIALIEKGASEGASFTYDTEEFRLEGETTVLTKLTPYEVTVATWGANPSAYVELYKSNSEVEEKSYKQLLTTIERAKRSIKSLKIK